MYFIANQIWNKCCQERCCKRSWRICSCNSIMMHGCSYWMHVSWRWGEKVISLISASWHSPKINFLCSRALAAIFSSCSRFLCGSSCLNFRYICSCFKSDSNVSLRFFHLYWCNLIYTKSRLTEDLLLGTNHLSFLMWCSNNFSSVWCFGAGAFYFFSITFFFWFRWYECVS